MSTTALSHTSIQEFATDDHTGTDECPVCEDTFRIRRAVAGSFCSALCHDRHQRQKAARNVLRLIEKDHRFCGTCHRQLKTVDQPPERWGIPDAVTGYQYGTEHAEDVWRDKCGRQATGLGCECGNCEHRHEDATLQSHSLMTAIYYLTEAVDELQEEGTLNVTLDREHELSGGTVTFANTVPTNSTTETREADQGVASLSETFEASGDPAISFTAN